jgi:hypothetical protein
MSDFNFQDYSQRKWSNFGTSGAKKTAATYANFLAQQRGARDLFKVGEQYEKDAPRTVSRFTRRGLAGPGVRSGVFNRGMTDLAKKNFDDVSNIKFGMADAENQFKLDTAQTQADYDAFIADLEAQKQGQIAQAAATLNAFKPFLGG